MISVSFIKKRHNAFIKNYKSMELFHEKIDLGEYSLKELYELQDYFNNIEYQSNLIISIRKDIEKWIKIKTEDRILIIEKLNFLTNKEKGELAKYLYEKPKGVLNFKFLLDKEKDTVHALYVNKVISLYRTMAICKNCGKATPVHLIDKRCPICREKNDLRNMIIKKEYILTNYDNN